MTGPPGVVVPATRYCTASPAALPVTVKRKLLLTKSVL
jgi:hypothetical protein